VGTGYRAKNRFFSTDENFKKSPHLFTLIFTPPDNVLLGKAMLVRYQLFITYMILLINVMFSSEHSYFTMACRAFHA